MNCISLHLDTFLYNLKNTMYMRTISYLISFLLLAACTGTPSKAPLTLWYDKPAQNWDEALPIGNGRAGAMVFGGVEKEQLQLNENTLYSGEPSVVFKDVKITPDSFRPGLQERAGTPAPILPTVRRPAYPKQQAGRCCRIQTGIKHLGCGCHNSL